MWVYIKNTGPIYTVGYWANKYFAGEKREIPQFNPVEDFTVEDNARRLVNYLNGGSGEPMNWLVSDQR